MQDAELLEAEAVLDGLAGLNCCIFCEDRPSYFACTETNPVGLRISFCTPCVRQFSRDNPSFYTVYRAARVLRYAAHSGWADDPVMARCWVRRFDPIAVKGLMVSDQTFRKKYIQWQTPS